jgi:hypothetical protein
MRGLLRTAILSLGVLALAWLLHFSPARAGQKTEEKKAATKTEKVDEAELAGGLKVFRAENELKKGDPKDKVKTDSASHMYTFFMRKGHKYVIECDSKEVDSFLRLEDSAGKQLAEDDDGAGYPNARIVFKCPKTDTYRIFVTTYGKEAEGKEFGNYGAYTLTIRILSPGLAFKDGKAEVKDNIAANDPNAKTRPGCHAKVYKIHLKAGKTYTIDLVGNAAGIGTLDTYLFLEDAKGTQLAFDDDSGGNLNARIVFPCQRTGIYQIVCTTFAPGAIGPFVLTVREQ